MLPPWKDAITSTEYVANKEWEQWTLEAMGSASTRLSGYVDLHNVAAVAVVISVDGLEMSLCLLLCQTLIIVC